MTNKKYLDKVEPPFLNRFEKMIISSKEMKSERHLKLGLMIRNELDINKNRNKLNYDTNYRLKNLLIGCNKEDLLERIDYDSDIFEKDIKDEKIIQSKIFNKIYKLFPQDIIVNLDDKNEIK